MLTNIFDGYHLRHKNLNFFKYIKILLFSLIRNYKQLISLTDSNLITDYRY